MQRESVWQSLLVATCLCIVCSVLVSTAAVKLKPLQIANKQRQMQMDVLKVAGLYQENAKVADLFEESVSSEIVDMESGDYVDRETLDPKAFDANAAARDPELSIQIPRKEDLAGLKRREKYASVFLIKNSNGELQQLILPVRGKGLWSTMYGFLSLEPPEYRKVLGITFYEHGETPGLGGEIESEKFCRQWIGKMVRDDDGEPHFEFVRGSVDPQDVDKDYKIDGIAGATITTRGVTDMIQFWMGPMGFKPLLDKLSAESVALGRTGRGDLFAASLHSERVLEER